MSEQQAPYRITRKDKMAKELIENFDMNIMRPHREAGLDTTSEMEQLADELGEKYAEGIKSLSYTALEELYFEIFPESDIDE